MTRITRALPPGPYDLGVNRDFTYAPQGLLAVGDKTTSRESKHHFRMEVWFPATHDTMLKL